jgi:hypothetical protein
MYTPDPNLPADVRARQEASLREAERAAEVARRQHERNRVAQGVEQKRQEAEQKAHREKLEQERLELAKARAAEDRKREFERYTGAGGDPKDFEQDYPAIRQALLARRIAEQEAQIAHPSTYFRGPAGGTSTTFNTRRTS